MPGPGWLPRGGIGDPYTYKYDITRGRWIAPEDRVPEGHQLIDMPPGFDPQGRGQGVHVVLSPPGTPAPPGSLSYTPAVKALHRPGEVAPIDLENLSVILAPRPGPPRPPMNQMPPPPSGPLGAPSPPPGSAMPPGGGAMPGPPPGAMPPQPVGPVAPPAGGMAPNMPMQQMQPQPMPQPAPPMMTPGEGKPPSLYSRRAHEILQSLLGTPAMPAGPVGGGQDVGVGADLASPLEREGDTFPVQGHNGNVQPHGGQVRGGSDIFADEGTPVVAMRAGRVLSITQDSGNARGNPGGNSVLIQGDDGNQYYYAHLRDTPSLQPGAQVRGGQQIGVVGTTGNARGTPPHLHFGMGPSISNGVGAMGGTGGNFDAVSLLNEAPRGSGMQLMSAQEQARNPQWGPSGTEVNRDTILREAQDRFGPEGARVVAAILRQEGGLNGTGDSGQSFGPFHFNVGGQLPAFNRDVVPHLNIQQAGQYAQAQPVDAARWAFDNYMGRSLNAGVQQGLSGDRLLDLVLRGSTRGDGQNSRADLRAYSQWLNEPLAQPGAASTPASGLWDSLPEPVRMAVTGLVDRVSGATPAYAQSTGPRGLPPLDQPDTISAPTGYIPSAGAPGASPPPGSLSQRSGQALDQGVRAAGGAISGLGTHVSQYGAQPRSGPGMPSTPPSAPPSATSQQLLAQTPPRATGYQVSPEAQYAMNQPPAQPSPRDPRLSATDPTTGLPLWGPAGTALPSPGDTPWVPWVIYGPDEGDGRGKMIDDPQLITTLRTEAAKRYESNIAQQLQSENRAAERERLQAQFAIAQETSRSQREQQLMIANTAHEDRVAKMQALEYERVTRHQERAGTMIGPAGAQIPQGRAPGGYFVDHIAGVAVALGEDGQPIATYQVGRPAPKSQEVSGFGIQQETINPQTRNLEYTPTGQHREQVQNGRALRESPRGWEQTGRLSEDPQVTRWTDPWGREMMLNTRTGERFVLNEGAPKMEQRGQRTYSVPPPATPRYTPPMFRPTTYGAPEIPYAQAQQQLPPGAVPDPRGGYWIQRPDEPTQPQFVQPPMDEERVMPMAGSYS